MSNKNGADDLAMSLTRVRIDGATELMHATDIPGVGRLAFLAEPERGVVHA